MWQTEVACNAPVIGPGLIPVYLRKAEDIRLAQLAIVDGFVAHAKPEDARLKPCVAITRTRNTQPIVGFAAFLLRKHRMTEFLMANKWPKKKRNHYVNKPCLEDQPMKYSVIMAERRGAITIEDAERILGGQQMLNFARQSGWLKPRVQSHRLTLFDYDETLACWKRICRQGFNALKRAALEGQKNAGN
jgi:hypothetical protein